MTLIILCRVKKDLPLNPIPRQLKGAHTIDIFIYLKIHFNIILQFTAVSPK